MASYEIETMIQDVWPMTQLVPIIYRHRVAGACQRFVEELQGGDVDPQLATAVVFSRLEDLPDGAISIVFQLVSIFRYFVEFLAKAGTHGNATGKATTTETTESFELFHGAEQHEEGGVGGGDEVVGDGLDEVLSRKTPSARGGALGSAGALYHKHQQKDPQTSRTMGSGGNQTAEQRAVSILDDAADVLHRLLIESKDIQDSQQGLSHPLLGSAQHHHGNGIGGAGHVQNYRDNPLIHTRGHVMLRILKTVLNSDGNAKLWVRWYGTEEFSVECWKFVDAIEKEVNFLPEHGRREIIEDYVSTELDFNHDGIIDISEFALGCPSMDVAKVIELRYEAAMRHSTELANQTNGADGSGQCTKCARFEAQLCLERRTTESLKQQLNRLKDREGLLREVEKAHGRIKDLTAELETYRNPRPAPVSYNTGVMLGYADPTQKHQAVVQQANAATGGNYSTRGSTGIRGSHPYSEGVIPSDSSRPIRGGQSRNYSSTTVPNDFFPDERERTRKNVHLGGLSTTAKSPFIVGTGGSRTEATRLQEAIHMLNNQRSTGTPAQRAAARGGGGGDNSTSVSRRDSTLL